jgi:predicted transcriptional regulator
LSYHAGVTTPVSRLLARARRGAGLTQRELARRARTSQSVVARIESGTVSPSFETLQRLVRSAGFELHATIQPTPVASSHMLEDVRRILGLSPEERLIELRNAARFLAAAKRAE